MSTGHHEEHLAQKRLLYTFLVAPSLARVWGFFGLEVEVVPDYSLDYLRAGNLYYNNVHITMKILADTALANTIVIYFFFFLSTIWSSTQVERLSSPGSRSP